MSVLYWVLVCILITGTGGTRKGLVYWSGGMVVFSTLIPGLVFIICCLTDATAVFWDFRAVMAWVTRRFAEAMRCLRIKYC